jgi:hypothetical protein
MFLGLPDPDPNKIVTEPQHCLGSKLLSRNADLLIFLYVDSPNNWLSQIFVFLSDVPAKCITRFAICSNNLHHRRGEKEHQGFPYHGNVVHLYSLLTVLFSRLVGALLICKVSL